MKFELYKSRNGWRFRLRAKNGKIVCNSGESYRNRVDCMKAIELVRDTDLATPIDTLTKGK